MLNEVKLANPNYDSSKIEEFKNVWVFCEQRQGQMMSTSYELISEGRKLADELGVKLCGLLVGDNVGDLAESIGGYGADEVIVCDHPLLKNYTTDAYAKVICDVISEMKPEAFLIGATNIGRDLGPRCAARLHTGLCADCTHLDVDMPIYKDFLRGASTLPEAKIDGMATAKVMGKDHDVSRDLKMTRPAFGGNIMAKILCPKTRPQLCTVRYKIFSAPAKTEPHGEVFRMELAPEKRETTTEVLEVIKKAKEKDISDAEIIVAAGRGIKKEEDFELVRRLADLLGAEIAGTRPIIELGWLDPKRQIGLSGRTVKPKLIITVGISGAVQFAAGMKNSDRIIAINSDPAASIFNIAHYGFVGDLYEILPKLIEKLAEEKQNV